MGTRFNADSRAKTRCYIINDDTNSRMTFQFNPTSIPYSRSANYTDIAAPGMSYPLTQYAGGIGSCHTQPLHSHLPYC